MRQKNINKTKLTGVLVKRLKLNNIQIVIRISLFILFYQNCFFTMRTYENTYPYPKSERVPINEIESISIDTNDTIKVKTNENSGCLEIGNGDHGSYFLWFKKNSQNQKCKSFNNEKSEIGALTLQNISNSAIIKKDKIILDFSSFPPDKFSLINPYVVWSASKGFYGYSNDPKVDSTFKNAYISNDYKYLFIEKKEKIFVFNAHDEKTVIRRIVIENLANKIIKSYKNKIIPIKFIRISEFGILSVTNSRNRLFYELTNTQNLYDISLDIKKDKEQDPNYKYIPLLPVSLIADIIISPIVIPVYTYFFILIRMKS
jgi:hypothetical protein